LRDQFCGGSIDQARNVLAATGGARQALKLEHWGEQVQAWKADNLFDSPGRERLAEFGDRAEAYVRDLEQSLDARRAH